MFLAIINDTYAVVKAESMSKKADFQMSDFFKTGVNNVRGSMGIQDRYINLPNYDLQADYKLFIIMGIRSINV